MARRIFLDQITQITNYSLLGNATGVAGTVSALTSAQVTALLNPFTTALQGLAPASGGGTINFLRADGTWASPPNSSGTVTTVSVFTANGVSGSVATPTTTPSITLTLGAITPTSVVASGSVTGSNLSGTNTGDQTIALTGQVTGSGTGSFATTIATNTVTLANLAQVATGTFHARVTAATGNVEAITGTQATSLLDLAIASGAKGLLSGSDKTKLDGIANGATANTGTVTTVSVTAAGGVSGSVLNASTTPAITLTLGAITPTSVAATGAISGSNFSGSSSGANTGDQTISLTGDVTGSGTGSFAASIAAGSVTLAKQANFAANSIQGNNTGIAAIPLALTGTQVTAMLDAFTSTLKGLAPASGGGTANFLRADGTWASPISSGGTVTSVSVTAANGVSGSVTNPTTTPAITLTLGAITPTSVAASGALSGSNFSGSSSGTNTGDQTITLTGVVTGSGNGSFATSFATSPAFSGTPTAPTATADTNTTQLATTAFVQNAMGTAGVATTGGATTVTAAQAGASVINITGTLTSNATISFNSGSAAYFNASYVINNATTGAFTVTIQACATTPASSVIITQGTSTLVTLSGANAARSDTDYTLFNSTTKGVVSGSGGGTTNFLRADGTWTVPPNSGGTVTSVSVTTANGVSGIVATPSSTPAITLTLGAITPTSVAASGAITGSNFSGSSSGANTGDQTIALTGDVTGSGTGSFAVTIGTNKVTLTQMAQVATGSVFYRKTAATGNPEVQTLATLKTDLGLTGSNSGDQTITLSGDVSGSGTGSFATTIAANAVTNAMLAQVATATFHGRITAAIGNVETLTATQATSLLDLVVASGSKGLMSGADKSKLDGIAAGATTNTGTVTSVTLTQPAAGITLTNSGTSQTTTVTSTIALANDLAALEALSSTGIARRTGIDTWSVGSAVALSEIATIATNTFIANATAGLATPTAITGTTATTLLDAFTATLKGLAPASGGGTTNFLRADGTWVLPPNSGGTVTTVSVATANGVSGTVANPTTTPAITLILGAITPTSVAASGTLSGSNFSGSSSGTNTGDQTITLTGVVTGSGTGSFATSFAASPTFTGTVTVPTPLQSDSSTAAASTAYVQGSLAIASVATTGGVTNLTTAQAGAGAILLTGTLISNTTINFSSGSAAAFNRTYTIINNTSGAFTVTVQACATAPSGSVVVVQGTSVFIYTNGATIALADVSADQAIFTSTAKGVVPASGGGTTNFLRADGTFAAPTGTVSSVSITTVNGVSGSVATSTTTPAISISLGAITPTSVAASGTVTGSNLSGTNTGDQTITLTGNVTGSGTGSFATTIGSNVVTLANMATVSTGTVFYRKTAATGNPEVQTLATLKTDLGLTGTNSGDQTITLTGDVAGTGTGSFAATIQAASVSLAKMSNLAANSIIGNNTGIGATPLALTGTQVTAMLDSFTTSLKGLAPASGGGTTNFLRADGTWVSPPNSGGTVTTVSVATANGVSGTVSNPTTTPAITLTLGAITPTSVAASGALSGSNFTGSSSGSNTGDQTIILTGVVTGSGTGSFATSFATSPAFSGTPTAPTATADTNTTQLATTAFVQTSRSIIGVATTGGASTVTQAQAGQNVINITGTLISNATISLGSGTASFYNTSYVINNATTGAFTVTIQACATTPGTSVIITQGTSTLVTTNGANASRSDTDYTLFTSSTKGVVAASGGGTTNFLRADGTWVSPPNSGGTVTTLSVTTANGVSGTVANPTTTPAITLTLGAITPTSVAASGTVTGSNLSGSSSGTNTGDQTITLTGNVTGSGTGSFATTIATNAVTLANMAQVATGTVFYRKTAATGNPEVQSLATLKTDLGLTGTNSGDQTITLTSDVTGSGTGSFAATISAGVVTLAKMANLAANSIIGNNTGSAATPLALSGTQVTAMLDAFTTSLKGLAPASGGGTTNFLRADGTWVSPPNSGGTVTTVSVTTANGVSGTVANASTTPAITLTLGAITPTSVAASGALSGSNFSGSSSGTNTGDQTITLTGVVTGSGAGSFATSFATSPAFSGTPTSPTATADTNTTQLATTAFVQTAKGVVNISTTGGASTVTSAQAGQQVINISGTLISNATISFGSGAASFFNTSYVINNATTGAFTVTVQACATTPGSSVVITQGTSALVTVNGANAVRSDTDYTLFNSTTKGVVSGSGGGTTNFLRADGTWVSPPNSGGTVTTVSVTTASGVSGTVTNPTTTPAITVTLGAITPTSVAASGALSGSNFSGSSSGTNTGDQTITLTGDVAGSGIGSFATSIAANAVTLAQMAQVATGTVFYRKTAATGNPEVQTLATLKTDLGLTGTNSGDQTISLTGDVTGSGTGSFAATIAAASVSLAKMSNLAANSIIGNNTGIGATPLALSGAQVTAMLDLATVSVKGLLSSGDFTKLSNLSGTNTGDQTITLTGQVSGSGTGSFATTLATNTVTLAQLAQVATGTFLARTTAATGNVEALTTLQAKTLMALNNVDNTSDANKPVSTATQTALNLKVDTSTLGAANGVATLDSNSKIPTSQLPALAITSTQVAASQTAQLAISNQEGDVVVRSDLNKTYIRLATSLGTMADYQELLTPTDTVLSVNGYTGAVVLTSGDIGLGNVNNTSDANKPVSTATQTALNLKANLTGATFSGAISATNLSGTNTGDQTISLTGDVTGSGNGSFAATIAAASVTLAKQANFAANSIQGNNTGTAATPLALSGTQVTAMLDAFTSTLKGLAPASGGGTTNFLRADGTWALPPNSGGTVTTVSVTTANGVSGTVATPSTTPAITISLGAITPTSVAASGAVTGLNLSGTNTGDQTITLTGQVTGSGTGSFATTLATNTVTLANMAQVATGTVFYRKTAATGNPEVQSLATLKTDLGLTGTNSGDQTITLTGDVTGSGAGSFAATIAAASVSLAKMANLAANSIIGNNTGIGATPTALTGTQVTAMLDAFTTSVKGLAPASGGGTTNFLRADGTWVSPPNSGGTVTTVSVTTANGVSGSVTNPTTTPAISITLGAITPTSVVASGALSGSNFSGSSSGANTGDQTITLTGVVTGSGTGSFATSFAASPAFSGTPTAPTATADTNTAQLATTAFVQTSRSVVGITTTGGATTVTQAQAGQNVINITGTLATNATISFGSGTTSFYNTSYVINNATTGGFIVTIQACATTPGTPVVISQGTSTLVTVNGANASRSDTDYSVFTSSTKGVVSASGGGTINFLRADGTWVSPPNSGGTVTTISVTSANGVSGSVTNPTTTPAITLTLGAITPTSVAASGAVTGSNLSGTNTGDQTITLTGQVTGSGTGSFATTLATNTVTLAQMAQVATGTVFYRKTAATGNPEVQTLATLKTDLGLTGTNSGDQTITLTSDVTGTGTGSFAATIAAGVVSLAKMSNLAANSIIGNNTGLAATPLALTGTQVTAMLDAFTTTLKGLAPASGGGTTNFLRADGTWASPPNSGGTVTTVSVTTANGVSGTVLNPTTTPALTISLGAITPTSVAASGALSGSNFSGSSSGTNTGDQTITLTGVVTGSGTGSFATSFATSPAFSGTPTAPTATADINTTQIATTAFVQTAKSVIGVATTGGATTVTQAQAGQSVINITGTLISNATISFGSGTTSFFNTSYVINNATTGAFTVTIQACATTPGAVIVITQGTSTLVTVNGANASRSETDYTLFTSLAKGAVPASGGGTTNFLRADGTWVSPPNSGGTVTTVSVTTANGVSGTVSNPTTTPAITLILGAITPTSVAASGAISGSNFSGSSSGANTGDQTITLTGQVTGSGTGSFATALATNTVTLAQMAQVATGTVFYRKTAATGTPEVQTLATLKTDLGLTGTNSGDQTITLTGDVTGTGTGSFAATIGAATVSLAKMANLAANSIIGNNTGSSATPIALTSAQVTAFLTNFTSALSGTVPASGGGTTTFLRADGTWATPAGGGGTTTNALTINNSGTGAASGSTFNGGSAVTISYNSIGAAPTASPTLTGTVTIPTPTADTNGTAAASTAYVQNAVGSVAISTTGGATTITNAQAGSEVINITGTLASNATISFGSGSASFFNRAYVINNNTTGAFTLTIQACVTGPGTSVVVTQGRATFIYVNGANVTTGVNDVSSLTVNGATLNGTTETLALAGGMAVKFGSNTSNGFTLYGGATNSDFLQTYRSGSLTWNMTTNNGSSVLNINNLSVNMALGLSLGTTNVALASPGAYLNIDRGLTSYAPIRLTTTSAALLTTPLSGVIETDGTSLFWTTAAATRYALASTNTFTSSVAGLVPASGGGTTTFLRADGTFAAPPGGSSSFTVVTKTATYTETTTSGEIIILADLVAGFTITLPTAVSNTAKLTIKKMQSAGAIVVNTTSSQTIDGGLTATLTTQYSAITLVSNNSNWVLI